VFRIVLFCSLHCLRIFAHDWQSQRFLVTKVKRTAGIQTSELLQGLKPADFCATYGSKLRPPIVQPNDARQRGGQRVYGSRLPEVCKEARELPIAGVFSKTMEAANQNGSSAFDSNRRSRRLR
jgi:hypothetical protein